MAHAHIARLKQDNLILSALVKKAAGEKLNSDEAEVLAELKKARELNARLVERYDLGGAIEKALRNRQGGGNTVAFDSADAMERIGRSTLAREKVKELDARDAEEAEKRAKVRADIERKR